MMKLVTTGLMLLLATGCAEDAPKQQLRDASGTQTPVNGAATTTPASGAQACAAAAPAALATDADATSVRIVGSIAYYQAGPRIMRVGLDGSGATKVHEAPGLTSFWADETSIVAVTSSEAEDDANLNATIVVIPVAGGEPVTTATNYLAAGTHVFAGDATNLYVFADTADGDTLVQLDRATGAETVLVPGEGYVVNSPQLANGSIWYVRGGNRVVKYTLPTEEDAEAAKPLEMFAVGETSCVLSVGPTEAYCTTPTRIESRDLTGGAPKVLKSTTEQAIGQSLYAHGSSLVIGASKEVRELKVSGEERVLVCGREGIAQVSVSGNKIAWAEKGKGIFTASF